VGGREGRLIRNFYLRSKFVHARVVYINANGTLKDTGALEQFYTPSLQQQTEM